MRMSGIRITTGPLAFSVVLWSSGVHPAQATSIACPGGQGASDPFWSSALRLVPGLTTIHVITTSGQAGDISLALETAGRASPPSGNANATVSASGLLGFKNDSSNPVTVTAIVSPHNAEEFTVSAGLHRAHRAHNHPARKMHSLTCSSV
jgi:hypothetical protein